MTELLDPPTNAESRGLCGVRRRQGPEGATCKRQAGWGTDHLGHGPCRIHGGAIPNVAKHYEAVVLEQRAKTLFGKQVDNRPIHNPLEVFAELAGEARGWLGVLRQLVADLSSPGYRSEMTGEQIRAEVQLYERAMDRANTVLATYARLNIDARLAAISEAQAAMVLGAVESALAAAGVAGARAIEARRVAASKLRVLEGEVKDR